MSPSSPIRRSGPTRICFCTTWVKGSPTVLPEGVADGREWRTAPLWGIGLTQVVSGHTFFLHDGRARSIEEAILWHGGEAEAARTAYARLSKGERDALIAFVNSL